MPSRLPHSDEGPALAARLLAAPGEPALELIEAEPDGSAGGAPLLFVHGAFAGAWCWAEHALPFFGRRGRRAAAVSLRGHGGSDGRDRLRRSGLDDMLRDVRRAVEAMPEPPVVIGHSLGGYLAQLLIGSARMRALVLVGSLPPDGMALVGPRLAMTETRIWSEALAATLANSRAAIDLAGLEILFGEGVPREEALRYGARLIPESPRALAEAHLPRPVLPAFLAGLPTLVLNGAADRLVWPATAFRTALYHGAGHRLFEAGGHFLMLDPCAEAVARHILEWLARRDL
ncbi:alpha/beta hydrolase [Enterovirga aerilata]|uniref:alpha/beta hydrolase n=1 Tax=Enterovirga aerilata TaxID=2730920 RepID=UPI003211F503